MDEEEIRKHFQLIWDIYPKKINKGQAFHEWNRIISGADAPHWKVFYKAILQQKKSDQWQNPKYIPLLNNWLKDEKWNHDPKEMIDYSHALLPTCPNGWTLGKDFVSDRVGCQECEEENHKIWKQCKLIKRGE